MRFLTGLLQAFLVALACLCLTGCFPFSDADQDEKNPLIGDGLAKKAAYNYDGAVESFEKALEGNPRLARAHWELALLYSQNVPNPAASIYHFEKLLKLRPDWPQADAARRLIDAAKIELAKSVPLGPQTPYMQQQLDKLTAQLHNMANENNQLRQQNQTLLVQAQQLTVENIQLKDKLKAFQTIVSPGTGQAGSALPQGTTVTRSTPTASPNLQGQPASAADPQARSPTLTRQARVPQSTLSPTPTVPKPSTYTVRAGDTLSAIAAAHGVKVRDLTRVNPSLNPDRLMVGQIIKLP